jgi:Cu(I)/Ag(I) efflux system membrane fusion protein
MSTPVRIVSLALIVAGAFLAGSLRREATVPESTGSSARVLYWACPMHPHYRSNHPGDCPSCGMRLQPAHSSNASTAEAGISTVAGVVQVNATKQQWIGVRTDVVQRASTSNTLRVPGRVTVDDTRLYRIVAANDGWIRELGNNPTGTLVRKDDVLGSYYVRDLVSTQQSYLYAFDIYSQSEKAQNTNVLQRNNAIVNLRTALDALRSLGMDDLQIEELRRTHNAASELRIYSPATGFVTGRAISPAQRFEKSAELYRIADISHVWVMADIFEKDREFLMPHPTAVVRYRGREFSARMSDALPQFDPQSRTLKTRFELDNPGFILRPDMFVDVELDVNISAAITVPADAVIDSGRQAVVYVDRGNGNFEPRAVKTGWRLAGRVQVTDGIEPGERIVVSGTFLIDSESRMQVPPAAVRATATAAVKDPVCGMEIDPAAPGAIQLQRAGNRYTFCSEKCRTEFQAKSLAKRQPGRDHDHPRGIE